jgi:hypothetical protein
MKVDAKVLLTGKYNFVPIRTLKEGKGFEFLRLGSSREYLWPSPDAAQGTVALAMNNLMRSTYMF